DYALYLLTMHLAHYRRGASVREAYLAALGSTGKVVALIGITLSAAVITWAFSPIKFQADMGILLAFMFLWNMLGALIIVPSLMTFLMPDRKTVEAQPAPQPQPQAQKAPARPHQPLARAS